MDASSTDNSGYVSKIVIRMPRGRVELTALNQAGLSHVRQTPPGEVRFGLAKGGGVMILDEMGPASPMASPTLRDSQTTKCHMKRDLVVPSEAQVDLPLPHLGYQLEVWRNGQFCKFQRGTFSEGFMRPDLVVVVSPGLNGLPSFQE